MKKITTENLEDEIDETFSSNESSNDCKREKEPLEKLG